MTMAAWASLVGLVVCVPGEADSSPVFEKEVRAVLKAYCLDCHGAGKEPKGGLDLRLVRFAAKGGDSGPALVAGDPDGSEMLQRMRAGEMPPGEKKVPADQIDLVERWIREGAKTLHEEPESLPPGLPITLEERERWAFRPLVRPAVPAVTPTSRIVNPIDAFVAQKLQANGLDLAPEADRRTLIRRATADLTGLVPTPEEVDAFVHDESPEAYERLIDRLLASPAYAERWARHWLDVAGYADSEGNGSDDTPRPYQSKYRDYVVRAMARDLPLDRFVLEQLAGDELVPRPWANLSASEIDTLAATGFLRNAPDTTATGAPDEPLAANQTVADSLKVVGSTLLGLTVGCAQCHDHRYDPISQVDYFRLRAVFEPALDPSHWRRPVQRLVSLYTDQDRAKASEIEAQAQALQKELDEKTAKFVATAIEKEIAKLPEDIRPRVKAALDTAADQRTEEQKALLASHPSVNLSAGVLYQYDQPAADDLKKDGEKVAAKRAEKPVEDFVSVLDEVPGTIPETKLFHRGDHRQPLDAVAPGDLTIAAPEGQRFEIPAKAEGSETSGRRLAYARHLMSGTHPLVGRVLANRIWMHHFGRGLSENPGDFGLLGQPPSHPELLDWLATEWPRLGWSLKGMHRLIMTSATYRQSSARRPEQDAVDSTNALLARYPVRRREAESLRDAMLEIAGKLDPTPFGPSVAVQEDAVGQAVPAGDSARRSVYLQVRRTRPVSFLAGFDAPGQGVNCDRRTESTSATQSLMLMNSDFVINSAKAMAGRVLAGEGGTGSPVERAWRIAYQRPAEPEETAAANAFLDRQRAVTEGDAAAKDLGAWTDLCQQLLSSNEFLYVD